MDAADHEPRFDDLTAEEVRVLGCLVEKEATTPDNYPLTLNSLRNACNQSTSREPVVEYDDPTVERALTSLRARGLTRTVHSTSNRATKYRHVLPDVLGLDPAETAVLAVLMLRGPQTVGELKGRTERQHAFGSLDETAAVLEALAQRELALHLERQPGQKDARWVHLLGAAVAGGPETGATDRGEDEAPAAAPVGDDAVVAEFAALLDGSGAEQTGLELLDLLDGVDPAAGPIVAVGAGTGIVLSYLRAAAPDAELYVIEPAPAMRTALHVRSALDRSLGERITVDPRPVAESLPPRACAVVVSTALGGLGDHERAAIWRFAAERMPVGAPLVVVLPEPHRPVVVERTCEASRRVGRLVYERWRAGTPVDDRTMRWTTTYRVLAGELTIAEHARTSDARCWSADDVAAEVAPHGLRASHRDGVAVVHR
jgi:uncharacterized protein YceH (UPF0502 family)/phospholipid N-methyltransferase